MSDVKYLVGSEQMVYSGIRAFSDDICAFLSDLSSALLKNRKAAVYPDIVSFAYFCRKANISRIKARYEGELRVGRGVAFHVAPSNVPINFAFSFLFGLLSGNANIVRVSSKHFPQTDIVCEEIRNVIANYPQLAQRNTVVSYPADDEISSRFSELADLRIIWGGDNTVNTFKNYPVKPRCVDIAFSDRYSAGVIDGKAVMSAEDADIKALANAFYNDTYLMDQNACSSPQMIFWLNADEDAKERFWGAVADVAKAKYPLEAESAVNKYMQLCRDIIGNDDTPEVNRNGNILYRAELKALPEDITVLRGSCGYFYEHSISGLDEITPYATQKFQTICYFGVDKEMLYNWAGSGELQGIDRIVPFGKALDIMEVWDGYDIIRFGSRIIDIG